MLTDQAEWAVCGRSAGVINMDVAKKQTVVVEVMALVGGHLLLPKVKLSKYIPADHTNVSVAATMGLPPLETNASHSGLSSSTTSSYHLKSVEKNLETQPAVNNNEQNSSLSAASSKHHPCNSKGKSSVFICHKT